MGLSEISLFFESFVFLTASVNASFLFRTEGDIYIF